MMQINLTTRKKSLPEKVIGTFLKTYNEKNNVVYKARYSSHYKDEGHDFNKSFKVLRAAYLFKYNLISNLDISIYEMLQFLCEAEIPFSLQILAEKLKIGDATLRKSLDNLENAELLEIVKSDGQGQPNYYIIRTPYFEKETFKGSSKDRYESKYKETPTAFLETEVKRLDRQIRKNSARKLRDIARKQNLSKYKTDIQKIVKENKINRLRVWHKIIKSLGQQNAINFDAIVWNLCHNATLLQLSGREFDAAFKRFLKAEFETAGMRWNEFLFDLAQELRAFYDARLSIPRTKKATAAEPAAADQAGEFEEFAPMDHAGNLRTLLEEKKKKNILPNSPGNFRDFLTRNGFNTVLSIDQILVIASSFYNQLTMQKITTELRR